MSLSDLDLVQQAMAPTEPGYQAPASAQPAVADKSNATVTSTNGSSNAAGADKPASATESADTAKDPLEGIDLSHLNEADRAALQPIIDALKSAAGKEGQEGGELDVDDILKQLDAAGDVADTLEGRLDKLLVELTELEAAQHAEEDVKKAEEKK